MRTVLGSSSTTKTSGERSCACITKSPTLSAVDFPHTGPLGLQTVPHGKTGVDLLIGCLPTFINLSSGQEWVVASLGAAALVAMSVEENDRMIRTRCWVTGVVNEAEGSGYSYRKNGGCWRCRVHRPVPGSHSTQGVRECGQKDASESLERSDCFCRPQSYICSAR